MIMKKNRREIKLLTYKKLDLCAEALVLWE